MAVIWVALLVVLALVGLLLLVALAPEAHTCAHCGHGRYTHTTRSAFCTVVMGYEVNAAGFRYRVHCKCIGWKTGMDGKPFWGLPRGWDDQGRMVR